MIPLIRLCYTLSWSRHQNVVTIVQLGCKGNIWFSCFHTFIVVAGPRSAVGNVSGYRCMFDCRSRGREFDPGLVPYFRGD